MPSLVVRRHPQNPRQALSNAASYYAGSSHHVLQRQTYTACIAGTGDEGSAYSYILAPAALAIGDAVRSGPAAAIRPGNALPLINIPVGQAIHNIELKPGAGGQLVRAAGTSAVLVSKSAPWCSNQALHGSRKFLIQPSRGH